MYIYIYIYICICQYILSYGRCGDYCLDNSISKKANRHPPEVLIVGGGGRGWGHCSCVFDMILYDDMMDGWG